MIPVLIISSLFMLSVALFVVWPFLQPQGRELFGKTVDGFADEGELRSVLRLRDELLARLVTGRSSEPSIQTASEADILDALVNIGIRLSRAGLDFIPKNWSLPAPVRADVGPSDEKPTSSSQGPVQLLVAAVAVLAASAMSLSPLQAQAQGDPQFEIPGLATVEQGQVPQIHQFFVIPMQGEALVQYLGVFTADENTDQVQIVMPLPQGFRDFQLLRHPNATLTESQGELPVVNLPVTSGVNEIRAQFFMDAKYGTFRWENAGLRELPGWSVISMPRYRDTLLLKLSEAFSSEPNVWPARFTDIPANYQINVMEDHAAQQQNQMMNRTAPPQYVQRLIKNPRENQNAYPTFQVVGIVPVRLPFYIMGGVFGAFLLGFAIFSFIASSKARAAKS